MCGHHYWYRLLVNPDIVGGHTSQTQTFGRHRCQPVNKNCDVFNLGSKYFELTLVPNMSVSTCSSVSLYFVRCGFSSLSSLLMTPTNCASSEGFHVSTQHRYHVLVWRMSQWNQAFRLVALH